MLVSEYREALVEVLEILRHANKEDLEKIPKKLISFFEKNASPSYKFTFDENKELKDLNLKNETKGLLAMIYRNYWCTPEERIEYDNLLKNNQKLYDEMIRQQYDPNKIFENNIYTQPSNSAQEGIQTDTNNISQTEELIEKENSIIPYTQNIFSKITDKLQEIISRLKFKSKSI